MLRNEPKANQTFDMVRAGLHCSLRISRQMLPLLLMLGWKTFVLNATYNIEELAKLPFY